MERKYKKQLASASSLHAPSNGSSQQLLKPMDTSSPARLHNHRASWHGNTRNNGGSEGGMLGDGFNSGSEESLNSSVADSTCSSSVFNSTVDSELNDSKTENNSSALTGEMQVMIKEQVQQYKSQMMEVWMKEAEEKMAAMEQSYLQKISSQQKLFHLQSANGVDKSETFV